MDIESKESAGDSLPDSIDVDGVRMLVGRIEGGRISPGRFFGGRILAIVIAIVWLQTGDY